MTRYTYALENGGTMTVDEKVDDTKRRFKVRIDGKEGNVAVDKDADVGIGDVMPFLKNFAEHEAGYGPLKLLSKEEV